MDDYVRDIFEVKGRSGKYYEIQLVRNGKFETKTFYTEEDAYNAYIKLCEEFYS